MYFSENERFGRILVTIKNNNGRIIVLATMKSELENCDTPEYVFLSNKICTYFDEDRIYRGRI